MKSRNLNQLKLPKGPIILASDFDDTMTKGSSFPSQVLDRIEKLSQKGVVFILVTGRPAGWCDFFARFLPVQAVVGENGAFVMKYNHSSKKMEIKNFFTDKNLADSAENFEKILKKVKEKFPAVALASDQKYRISDMAIDFCEDVKPHSLQDAVVIKKICESFGAQAKISSIHVNTWYGEFDKQSSLRHYVENHLKMNFDQLIYVGDSPNDQPLFDQTKFSVGVKNVEKFDDMRVNYITKGESAEGFLELADYILKEFS